MFDWAAFWQAALSDLFWRCCSWFANKIGAPMNRRPINMRVDLQNSQVSHWHHSLEANIAVRFENSSTSSGTVRQFRAYLIKRRFGFLNSRLDIFKLTVVDVQNNAQTVDMETGLTVPPGISSRYYVRCYLSPFRREEQSLQIIMEVLNQGNQIVEIVPDWPMIIHNELTQNTVISVKYRN